MKTETAIQAVESNSLSLFKIEKAQKGTGLLLLKVLLAEVVMFFNVGKTMNDYQIHSTAELLLQDNEARNMKPEDYKVMFDNAKKGIYGKQFDRLDGQVIFEWKTAYMSERLDICEQISIKKHKGLIEQNKSGEINKEGQKKVLEILKNVLETVKPPEEKNKNFRVKTERDIFIQKCLADFYSLWLKKPIKNKNGEEINFIIYHEKEVDQVEYTEILLKEYDNALQKL